MDTALSVQGETASRFPSARALVCVCVRQSEPAVSCRTLPECSHGNTLPLTRPQWAVEVIVTSTEKATEALPCQAMPPVLS